MTLLLYHIKSFLERNLNVKNIDDILEIIIVNYYKLFSSRKIGIQHRRNKRKVIVSLTTIPDRIDKVWITIESLLRQTYKPDQIILWLAEDEFANCQIPSKLWKQCERGLTIRYCENLKSYKKFYDTAREYVDAYIVTVDDDVIYSENLLRSLIKEYVQNPGCIICTRSHWIRQCNGKLLPYNHWIKYEKREGVFDKPSFQNFFVGCGGTFFPMFLMDRKKLLDKDTFMEIAPTADDVWLNFNAWIAGMKTKNIPGVLGNTISIQSSSDRGLFRVNKKKNDEQIVKTLDFMGINIKEYMD